MYTQNFALLIFCLRLKKKQGKKGLKVGEFYFWNLLRLRSVDFDIECLVLQLFYHAQH